MHQVYLVDDEPLVISNMADSIAWPENGFEVVGSSTSPRKALEEIPVLLPDLVFCDLKMPEMSGIELIHALREKGIGCEFVILSAFAEFEASRSLFRMGGFDYLLKPLAEQEAEIVLERLSRKLSERQQPAALDSIPSKQTAAFESLVAFITENYSKKHTLASLSQQFNISQSYICSLFTRHYSSTLTSFLTDLRMRSAAEKLRSTNDALKEIAVDCGYSDYFYFCRVFKSYHGVPPTEYKQRHRNGGTL